MDNCRPIHDLRPIHTLPDSERILRRHDAWIAEWDASATPENEEDTFNALVKKAFDLYAAGYVPIQVRWLLQGEAPTLPASLRGRAQRRAEKALLAAETAPPELRRALVAAQRQRAIQGALAAGEWSAALKGIDRAGEIAGELRESAGLGDGDLCLTVAIEAPTLPLPAAETDETPEAP